VLIACFCVLLAVFYQESNRCFLNGKLPAYKGMLTSADEASYFAPPRNFMDIGVWKDNFQGIIAYFHRPPGYGLIYLSCHLFGETSSYFVLKLVQIGMFFGSILLFGKILLLYHLNEKAILLCTLLYGIIPFASGFMYFTLTEAVSPFFLLWSVYEWRKLSLSSKDMTWEFILSNAFVLLLRPQLILFPIINVLSLLYYKKLKAFFWGTLVFLPFVIWQIRSITIAQSWPGLHPIYSESNTGLFRPSHEKMTDLFRVWEHDGQRFHTVIRALQDDSTAQGIVMALEHIPAKYRVQVAPVLRDYQQLIHTPLNGIATSGTTNFQVLGEKRFYTFSDSVRASLISQYPEDFYLRTPLKSLKKMVISSHLNLAIFQQKFRGLGWMEGLRWICVLLIIGFMLSCCSLFLLRKVHPSFNLVLLAIFGTLFYLVFVQRLNEERYITPLLPLLFIGFILFSTTLFQKKTTSEEVVFKNL
jgi:hypothetical protein